MGIGVAVVSNLGPSPSLSPDPDRLVPSLTVGGLVHHHRTS